MATISAPVTANAADWQLNGDAAYSGSTDVLLEPTSGSSSRGNVVYKSVLVADALHLEFRTEASGGSGADGFSFSFFDPAVATTTSIGSSGSGIAADNVRGVHIKYSSFNSNILIRTCASGGNTDANTVGVASPRGVHDWVLDLVRTAADTHSITLTRDGASIYSSVSKAITDTILLAFGASRGGSDDNHYVRNFVGTADLAPATVVGTVGTVTIAAPADGLLAPTTGTAGAVTIAAPTGTVQEVTILELWAADESQKLQVDVELSAVLLYDPPVTPPPSPKSEAQVRARYAQFVIPTPTLDSRGRPT